MIVGPYRTQEIGIIFPLDTLEVSTLFLTCRIKRKVNILNELTLFLPKIKD